MFERVAHEDFSITPHTSVASQELWDLFHADYVEEVIDHAIELCVFERGRVATMADVARVAMCEGYLRALDDTRQAVVQALGEVGSFPPALVLGQDGAQTVTVPGLHNGRVKA